MFFFFTVGASDFGSPVGDHANQRFYCPRCHNTSVEIYKERKFFTFCFVPLIPIHWGLLLRCTICPWRQDTSKDAVAQMTQGTQLQNQPQMAKQ